MGEDGQNRHNQRYKDDHIEDGQQKDENWKTDARVYGSKGSCWGKPLRRGQNIQEARFEPHQVGGNFFSQPAHFVVEYKDRCVEI